MKFLLLLLLFPVVLFAQQTLPVYAKADPKSKVLGELAYTDSIVELPIPKQKKKVTEYVKDKKTGKKKKTVRYVEIEPTEPPAYVPVKTKFAKKGYVKRADLARFKEKAADLSGKYSSKTGFVTLEKSPNSPGKFNITIQNGPNASRAEISAGNVQMLDHGLRKIFEYKEAGCELEIALHERTVKVEQKGCAEYNAGEFTLAGFYDNYEELKRTAEVFNEPEHSKKFKKYRWCPAGEGSCELIKDPDGCKVEIVWSVGGTGMIERRCGESVHKYRPFERMIPGKADFRNGEKPLVWKTKRTDMANEWMVWYYYPKAEAFKMVRSGTRADAAYMELYE